MKYTIIDALVTILATMTDYVVATVQTATTEYRQYQTYSLTEYQSLTDDIKKTIDFSQVNLYAVQTDERYKSKRCHITAKTFCYNEQYATMTEHTKVLTDVVRKTNYYQSKYSLTDDNVKSIALAIKQSYNDYCTLQESKKTAVNASKKDVKKQVKKTAVKKTARKMSDNAIAVKQVVNTTAKVAIKKDVKKDAKNA